jgi:aspartate ammonia-lyase
MGELRTERDSIGEVCLPKTVLYGINTQRASDNFPLSLRPISTRRDFIHALATVKQAAAKANLDVGGLRRDQADAISQACEEIKAGRHCEFFVVDILEGSGGTSTNMNLNEVIANVCALSAGLPLGEYTFVHPNDHANLSQSTNDVIPTAMKLAAHRAMGDMVGNLRLLATTLRQKSEQFATTLRLGRTCLQDAQPMTLGQAFGGYASVVTRHADQLDDLRGDLLTVPLGGTAIGTGFGARPGYKAAVFEHLSELVGAAVEPAADPFDGMQNMDVCARVSAELRNAGNTLWKIASDLTILSSGPAGGLAEITLPSVQAGSSIMPGKVNPVIPMAVCQVAFAITGNDATIAMACQQGMLEINHFELLVCDRLLDSIELLSRASRVFAERCVSGLVSNDDVASRNLMASSAIATALVPRLGYSKVSSLVRTSIAEDRNFIDVACEGGLIEADEVISILRDSTRGPEAAN